jgi:flagellar basal-body rod protein FlgG
VNNSMITASISMGALQQKLDLLADNISNTNTVGYKRKTAVFEDILTNTKPQEKDFELPGRRTPLGFTQGWGARLSTMQLDLSQGSLQQTGNMTDVAIEGNALFEVRTGGTLNSSRAFTRSGSFQLISSGGGERTLVTNTGYPVVAEAGGVDSFIVVPAGYNLSIQPDGNLLAIGPQDSTPIQLGKLKMAQVTKPELLQAIADNLYGVPQNINIANVVNNVTQLPAETSGIAIRQGYLENSNVNLTDEMADLMIVQRAYQLSARAITSSDQMMGMANNLRG